MAKLLFKVIGLIARDISDCKKLAASPVAQGFSLRAGGAGESPKRGFYRVSLEAIL
jgi:hypothetical protein